MGRVDWYDVLRFRFLLCRSRGTTRTPSSSFPSTSRHKRRWWRWTNACVSVGWVPLPLPPPPPLRVSVRVSACVRYWGAWLWVVRRVLAAGPPVCTLFFSVSHAGPWPVASRNASIHFHLFLSWLRARFLGRWRRTFRRWCAGNVHVSIYRLRIARHHASRFPR